MPTNHWVYLVKTFTPYPWFEHFNVDMLYDAQFRAAIEATAELRFVNFLITCFSTLFIEFVIVFFSSMKYLWNTITFFYWSIVFIARSIYSSIINHTYHFRFQVKNGLYPFSLIQRIVFLLFVITIEFINQKIQENICFESHDFWISLHCFFLSFFLKSITLQTVRSFSFVHSSIKFSYFPSQVLLFWSFW